MVVAYRNELYNDRNDQSGILQQSLLDAGLCFSDRNRFFRLASGGITYHFSCLGWKTGTGTIVISGRRQFRRFTRSFIGGFAGGSLWQRASSRFYTFCFGCYRCHVSDLQMVQILSQPNERAKGYSEKGCTFAFTDG